MAKKRRSRPRRSAPQNAVRRTRIAQRLKAQQLASRPVSKAQKRRYAIVLIAAIIAHAAVFALLATFVFYENNQNPDVVLNAYFSAERSEDPKPLEEQIEPTVPDEVGTEGMEVASASKAPIVTQPAPAAIEPTRTPLERAQSLTGYTKSLENNLFAGGAGDSAGRASRNTDNVDELILPALEWLIAIQQVDGNWTLADVGPNATPGEFESDVAATSLALKCLLRGRTKGLLSEEKFLLDDAIKNAVRWLYSSDIVKTKPSTERPRQEQELLCYEFALVTSCLVDLLAVDDSQSTELSNTVERLVEVLQSWQNMHDGGWGYDSSGPSNLSVTGWTFLALRDAQSLEFPLLRRTAPLADVFFDSLMLEDFTGYRYMNSRFATPAMSATGTICKMHQLDPSMFGHIEPAMQRIAAMGPNKRDAYFNFRATQALFNFGGPLWKDWRTSHIRLCEQSQLVEGDAKGSWVPTDLTAYRAGQLYQTCMTLLAIQEPGFKVPMTTFRPKHSVTDAMISQLGPVEEPPLDSESSLVEQGNSTSERTVHSDTTIDSSPAQPFHFLKPIAIRIDDREFTIGPNHPSSLVRDVFKNIELVVAGFDAEGLHLENVDLKKQRRRGWGDGYNHETTMMYQDDVASDNFTVCWTFQGKPKAFKTHRMFSYVDETGTDIAFEELIALEVGFAVTNAVWTQYGVLDARVPRNAPESRKQRDLLKQHHLEQLAPRKQSAGMYSAKIFGEILNSNSNRDDLAETIFELDWEMTRGAETRKRRFLLSLLDHRSEWQSRTNDRLGPSMFTKQDIARVGLLALHGLAPPRAFDEILRDDDSGWDATRISGGETSDTFAFNRNDATGILPRKIVDVSGERPLVTTKTLSFSSRARITYRDSVCKGDKQSSQGMLYRQNDYRVGFGSVVASQVFRGGFLSKIVYGRTSSSTMSNGDLYGVFYSLNDAWLPEKSFSAPLSSDWLGHPIQEIQNNVKTCWTNALRWGEGYLEAPYEAPTGGLELVSQVLKAGAYWTPATRAIINSREQKLYDDVCDRAALLVALLNQTTTNEQDSPLLTSIAESGFRRDTRQGIRVWQRPRYGFEDPFKELRSSSGKTKQQPQLETAWWFELLATDSIEWRGTISREIRGQERSSSRSRGQKMPAASNTYRSIAELLDFPSRRPPVHNSKPPRDR